MKKAVVYYKNTDNIGDDIQTYAAQKLMGKADYFLDRENLHIVDVEEHTKLLCNGWFMKNPENWPPDPKLNPKFISIYIDHKHGCYEKMLNSNLKPYYNHYGPIGCRDLNTQKLFQDLGVNSYYSGCVTLTLPKYVGERNDEILLVDPFAKVLDKKYVEAQIKRMIPEKWQDKVTVLTHNDLSLKNLSIEERLVKAEKLLQRYAQAKLIITSRIHCALPATAMGTPVYFMKVGYDRKHADERLEGLIDFFEVVDDKHFTESRNSRFYKLKRKLGLYSKSPITTPLFDFELKEKTLNKFETKQLQAKLLAEKIRKEVQTFTKE